MNDVITSREELFLAKLAGRDVDIRTMTPPVASNLSEKLMLEIADRLDNMGGGSSDTYETVAEIEVGEMQEVEGAYLAETEVPFQTFSESEVYCLNTSDFPNDGFATDPDDNTVLGILWNCKMEDSDMPIPLDQSKPYTAILKIDEAFAIVADTPDLSNTTVRILKKASAPSGGGKFGVPITMSQQGISSDVTLDQIKSAFDDKQSVVAQYSVGTGTAEIPLIEISETLALFSGFISTGEKVEIRYQTVGGWGFKRTPTKATYEFGFTVTPGSEQGTFVATPDTGVTFAAITAALAETPNVYAVLDLGFINRVVRALFSVDYTVSGAESTSAIGLFYDGTKFQAARLMVSANDADIVIKDT